MSLNTFRRLMALFEGLTQQERSTQVRRILKRWREKKRTALSAN